MFITIASSANKVTYNFIRGRLGRMLRDRLAGENSGKLVLRKRVKYVIK